MPNYTRKPFNKLLSKPDMLPLCMHPAHWKVHPTEKAGGVPNQKDPPWHDAHGKKCPHPKPRVRIVDGKMVAV